jgi:LmbE family N-acetylglucosaminyl deacetylase
MFRRRLLLRYLVPWRSRPFAVTTGATLIFAPHQDDETLGCGGLIALKRRLGAQVRVVFLTDGGYCYGDLPAPERQVLVARREAEALAALSHLVVPAADIAFWHYPDGGLTGLADAERAALHTRLIACLCDVGPAEIYVPHRRDSHRDHEATYRLVAVALAASGITATLYEYPVWLLWSRSRLFANLRWGDLARAYRLDIRDALDAKRAAVSAYPSQLAELPHGFVDGFLTGSEFYFLSAATTRPPATTDAPRL